MIGIDYANCDGNKAPSPAPANIRFAYIRATDSRGELDPTFNAHRNVWPRVGAYMPLGWPKDGPTPEDQVVAFVQAIGCRREGELPPVIDLEADTAASVDRTPKECLEWAERAYDRMAAFYACMVYTSARVWIEVFGDLPSKMGSAPLWIKVPYVYKANNPPHYETAGAIGDVPAPWLAPSSPGVWIQQFQGDAKKVLSGTVDLNQFQAYGMGTGDRRDMWVRSQLAKHNCATVTDLQLASGLNHDGIVGPDTFAYLANV